MTGKVAAGVGWMVFFKFIDRILAIISILVLARLLLPADFGLVAMAMSVIAIADLLTSFSFDVALIQKREPTRAHYDTAWTLHLFLSCSCALLVVALAYPSAVFFHEPRLLEVMLVLALAWFIAGFENVGIVDFRRQLNFRREFYFLALRRILSFLITVTLTFAIRSYWALVIGTVAHRLIGVVLSYAMHPFRPRFSIATARELFGFSSWLLLNNVLAIVQDKVSHFVLGKMLGPEPLGLYTVGSDVARLPSTDLLAPINRVAFPGLSRHNNDIDKLRGAFLDMTAATAIVAVPAAAGLVAVADLLVLVLMGEKWLQAVPVMQVLAFVSVVYGFTSITGPTYLALGEPRIITALAVLRLLVLATLVSWFVEREGLLGAAYAELAAMLMSGVASLLLVHWRLQIAAREFVSRVWRTLLASGAMAAAVWSFQQQLPSPTSSLSALPLLIAAVMLGVATYLAMLGLLWYFSGRPLGGERLLLDQALHWWENKRPRTP
ncbi:MAG: lipopolysaccharide biosynthesis protein [Sutterellaceae bacterium]|nr:lipopolysaccharide biosynthesis protein [Burkholderiaceae bacterium]MDW8430978.1 lipopolysaccharide biosynthesis protein [Sutterellaceae bacterium]